MNDQELDALLETWEPPEPSPSLLEAVRHGVPHGPAKRSYRWLAAAAAVVMTAGLAGFVAMGSGHAQNSGGGSNETFFEHVSHSIAERHLEFAMWVHSLFGGQGHQAGALLYVDGRLSDDSPRMFSDGSGVHFYLPDLNIYVLTMNRSDLQPAGTVRDATVRFEWQGRKYRISAGKRLVAGGEQSVYVLKYEDFQRLRR